MSLSLRVISHIFRKGFKQPKNYYGPIIRLKHSLPVKHLRINNDPHLCCRNKYHIHTLPVRCFASDADFPSHIKVPLPALSPTMEMGTLVSWEKKEGDKLNEGDLLAEIETDKATMGFETPEEGYLAKILVPAGQKDIPIGKLLCIIVESQEDIAAFKDYADTGEFVKSSAGAPPPPKPAPPPVAPPPAVAAAPPPPPPAPTAAAPPVRPPPTAVIPSAGAGSRVFASPLARKLAAEKGIDLRLIQGSGPQGRIRAHDLDSAPAGGVMMAAGFYQDIPLDQLRQVTIEKLVESKKTIPHYYLTIEAEIDELQRVQEQLNSILKKDQLNLTLTDFVIKAAAMACLKVPDANASWQGTFIRQFSSVDVSVAVNTPHGSITPVVFNADGKGLSAIRQDLLDLEAKAQDGKLQPQEYQGGTFYVADVSAYGVSNYSPIITPPNACALGIGGVSKRIVPCNKSKEGYRGAHFLTITLSCDHRVVDGAVGAQWLSHFKQYLEKPQSMLL